MDQDSVTFGRMPDPGETTSLRDVYDARYRWLVVQVCGVTGNLAEAEEAVGEAFVRAVASERRFWRVADPEAWLRTTAIHVHRTRRRRWTGSPTMPERGAGTSHRVTEPLAPQPAFDLVEAAGLARRRRRHAVAGTLATFVLALTAFLTGVDGESPGPGPAEASAPTEADPARMTTPAKRTYELSASEGSSLPAVRITVPTRWTAWLGPGRRDGLVAQVMYDELVFPEDRGSYVGLLVAEVTGVTQRDCTAKDVTVGGPASLVRALADAPRLEVISGPERTIRSGRTAVRLRLREHRSQLVCPGVPLFETSRGPVAGGYGGTTYDAWVVDVDGEALLVWAGWTRGAPRSDVAALWGIVDSMTLRDRE